MKKAAFGLIILVVAAGFLLRAVFPYYNAFLMDGIVKSIEYNSDTEEAECIMVDEKTGKIVEFKATGKRWKIVEVDNCIQVKMYPFLIPTKAGAYKMVALEKILNCEAMNKESQDQRQEKQLKSEEFQNQKQYNKDQYKDEPEKEVEGEAKDSLKETVLESGQSVEI